MTSLPYQIALQDKRILSLGEYTSRLEERVSYISKIILDNDIVDCQAKILKLQRENRTLRKENGNVLRINKKIHEQGLVMEATIAQCNKMFEDLKLLLAQSPPPPPPSYTTTNNPESTESKSLDE